MALVGQSSDLAHGRMVSAGTYYKYTAAAAWRMVGLCTAGDVEDVLTFLGRRCWPEDP